MIDNAWDEYRAWAGRARALQASSRLWNLTALVCAAVAAVLGTAAGQVGGSAATVLAALAAVAAAVTPVLGRDILSVGREAGWIRARATAEAIKSECFLFAAGAGAYADPAARARFATRRDELSAPARRANLQPLPLPAQRVADPRQPPVPLDPAWYLTHRLGEQMEFYREGQARHARAAQLLRTVSLVLALAGVILGALGSSLGKAFLGPWVAVVTTFGSLLVAYGLMDRREYLAASYSAMQVALGRIGERFNQGGLDGAWLVGETEQLLVGEHAAWAERLTRTIPRPPPMEEAPALPL